MAASEAFDNEWLRSVGGAGPIPYLWQALQADGGRPGSACAAAFRSLHTQLDTALATLRTLAEGVTGQAGPGEEEAPGWLAPWLQGLARLGPWQEAVGRTQDAQAALHRYTAAYSECATALLEAVRTGLQDLEAQLGEAADDPERTLPQSCQELHRWWTAAGEARHEALLGSERWAAAFGRLTNAATELIGSCQAQLDAGLRHLDLPNREDFIDTQRRLAQLERERSRDAGSDEIKALRAEIAHLREEVATLRRQSEGPESP